MSFFSKVKKVTYPKSAPASNALKTWCLCGFRDLSFLDFQKKSEVVLMGWDKVIFDSLDYEFLRLAGISRYIPTGLCRRYDSPIFSKRVIYNLLLHRLIKIMNDKRSYKLTVLGRECLAEMGDEFCRDARSDIKKTAYEKKLRNAQWNVLLTVAGIDIYCEDAKELAEKDCRYMSSFMLRTERTVKVLAGARFLGILKLADTAYVPYYVEDENSWVLPHFEREMYESQIKRIGNIKNIKLILIGESLEELWTNLNGKSGERLPNGRKTFRVMLEEFPIEHSLIPFGRDGVMQISLMKIWRYRERIAEAMGCKKEERLPECDGVKDGTPYIIAFDCNEKRIVRAIKQVERYNKDVVPRVCCLPFQKSTIIKMIKKNHLKRTILTPIPYIELYKVFPELEKEYENKPYIKEGEYVEVRELWLTKAERENIPD